MKDALGHGSNSHEIIDTKNGNRVVSQHSSHRKALNATNKLEPTPKGQMPKGGWQYQIRPIAQSATVKLEQGSQDAMARASLASGPKSAAAPVHDSMQAASRAFSDQTSVMRAKNQSDASYIAQRLTENADRSAGMARKTGESNASYIKRRIS